MTLNLYSCRFFNCLDWQWQEVEVLATDTASLRRACDKICEKQYRSRPVYREGGEPVLKDSLTIVYQKPVEIPYVVRHERGY